MGQSKERRQLFGKDGICHCGTCESATQRAIAIIGKALDDKECLQYTLAIGIGMVMASLKILRNDIIHTLVESRNPLDAIIADAQADFMCNEISDMITDWMHTNDSLVDDLLNAHIKRANDVYEEEQNLPKGD